MSVLHYANIGHGVKLTLIIQMYNNHYINLMYEIKIVYEMHLYLTKLIYIIYKLSNIFVLLWMSEVLLLHYTNVGHKV